MEEVGGCKRGPRLYLSWPASMTQTSGGGQCVSTALEHRFGIISHMSGRVRAPHVRAHLITLLGSANAAAFGSSITLEGTNIDHIITVHHIITPPSPPNQARGAFGASGWQDE
jgi:hypothetical protein